MKLYKLLGYFLFFEFPIYEISSEFIQSSNHTIQKSPPSNVTWIKLVTFDPKDKFSCENCTSSDYDDHNSNQRRKRRKRRRHKKPTSDRYDRKWNQQRRTSSEHSYKKYSTRVRLDKPVRFQSDFSQDENIISKTDVETKTIIRPFETTTQAVKSIPPPVRYLLPPLVDQYFTGNSAISNLARKKPTKHELLSHHRGSTKFKNTIYYKDDGIDVITNEIYYTTTPLTQSTEQHHAEVVKQSKPIFKPIVVPPAPVDTENATRTNHIAQREMSNFLAPEVAKTGMKVVNMNSLQERLVESNAGNSQPQNFPQLRPQFEEKPSTVPNYERTYEYQDGYQWNNRFQAQSPATQNYEQVQPEPRNQVPAQTNYEEIAQRNQQPPRISYQQKLSVRTQKTTVPQVPDEYVRTMQPYNQLAYENHPSVTRQMNTLMTPVPTEYSTNSTVQTTEKQSSNFKGLELAESNYFSDLPTQEEVSSLVQSDGEVIPGIAGKDYPIFSQTLLRKRRFACRGLEGYFADISSRCQVFYICNGVGAGEPMLCPNGTLFSQELLVCDWWYNVDC